jgi:hypothetical protein
MYYQHNLNYDQEVDARMSKKQRHFNHVWLNMGIVIAAAATFHAR